MEAPWLMHRIQKQLVLRTDYSLEMSVQIAARLSSTTAHAFTARVAIQFVFRLEAGLPLIH